MGDTVSLFMIQFIYIYIYIYIWGSIPGWVIPKTQKIVLDTSFLKTQRYKVQIKGKVNNQEKGVASFTTLWYSSYRKGSLRFALDYGRQQLLYMYIYIYI